ncbi:MAG: tRNA dihydrouridine synthase DusB [Bdellovibrionia bacterium]
MHPIQALRENPFVLAPMAAITDHPFRSFMKKKGAGVVVSELVSATGIDYNNEKTLRLMGFDEVQRPVAIQIFGEEPETMARAAQVVEQKGADFVDINFGCPVPKVVKKGAGSAALKDLPHLTQVVRSVVKAVSIPVTIKIRTGWDAQSINAHDVAHIAYNEGVSWVAIHGRTRAQGYNGQANWDYIAEVKAQAKLPIIGNGDVTTPEQAVQRLKESGCDGVMIGRGCLKNPFIFMDSLALYQGREPDKTLKRDLETLFLDLMKEIEQHSDERVMGIQMRKFASWFSTGYAGSSNFRKNIFNSKDNKEVLSMALEFFASISQSHQEDTSQEPFLMGGHG